jgi:iron(III) transport system substrate-binding protein
VIIVVAIYFISFKSEEDTITVPKPQSAIQNTVVWYTSLPTSNAEKIANAFQLETNNTIRVEVVRGATNDMTQKILDEIANENVSADVFHVADMGAFINLRKHGNLMYYNSPEYTFYYPEYREEGFWAAMRVIAIGMAHDSNRILDPPKSWADLLDPKWKGRIGLKNIRGGTAYAQYYLLRQLLGKSYWENISKNEPTVYDNYGGLGDAALEGDIDVIGEFASYKAYDYSTIKGTSIKWINPVEGVPMVPCPVAILKNAKHPEEAKLLLDFLLSKEGQEITQRIVGTYSARVDVTPLDGKPLLTDLKQLLPESWEHYEEEKETINTEVRSLFEQE